MPALCDGLDRASHFSWSSQAGRGSDRSGGLALGVACRYHLALVIQSPSLCQGQQDLGFPVSEVEIHRHHRQSLLLGLSDQLIDLLSVEKELSPSIRFVTTDA